METKRIKKNQKGGKDLYLLRCEKYFQDNDSVFESIDIVKADSLEQAKTQYLTELDIADWTIIECRLLTIKDVELYLLKDRNYFTLREP